MDGGKGLGEEDEPEVDDSMNGEEQLGDNGEQLNDSMDGEDELGYVNGVINSLIEGTVPSCNEYGLTVAEYDYLANLEVEEFTMNNITSIIF
eukprot:4295752-Ditylum_brightwellii.AAC.1